jgi:hypothetical protein
MLLLRVVSFFANSKSAYALMAHHQQQRPTSWRDLQQLLLNNLKIFIKPEL